MRRLLALLLLALPAALPAAVPVEQAQVIRAFPHDTSAFTEGLLFHDGHLYESTGYAGHSFIREEDLATGRVLQSVKLPPDLFGEGIVNWGHQLISLTWRSGTGFRWSLDGLKKLGEWHYAGEGWALTQDGHRLIMSDGTPVLRFLDPVSLKVIGTLKVTIEGAPLQQVNELEYVHGEILANIWMTNLIARIDPKTGVVKGLIDVGGLAAKVATGNPDAVPNGIAYDAKTDRLFVTGKDWPTIFQIKLPAAD